MPIYNKLVRDRIPAIIERAGKTFTIGKSLWGAGGIHPSGYRRGGAGGACGCVGNYSCFGRMPRELHRTSRTNSGSKGERTRRFPEENFFGWGSWPVRLSWFQGGSSASCWNYVPLQSDGNRDRLVRHCRNYYVLMEAGRCLSTGTSFIDSLMQQMKPEGVMERDNCRRRNHWITPAACLTSIDGKNGPVSLKRGWGSKEDLFFPKK